MITVDFETEAIVGNPTVAPPKPVGVAIHAEGEPPFYTADFNKLLPYWNSNEDLLFHNAPFDVEVAVQHLGLRRPTWGRVHDTMFPLFFADPYAKTLSLKPSAERYLNEPPEEQNALHDWILRNVHGSTKKNAGAYISEAPFDLVEPYAIGDVTRTKALFDKLMPDTPLEPYNRERELSPILIEGTQRGVRIDRERLANDLVVCQAGLQKCRDILVSRLGCHDDINFDSGTQLAEALDKAGMMESWVLTPTGKRSTSKDNLRLGIKDPVLLDLLAYYSSMGTCIGTFMLPWMDISTVDGRVHPEWNSVRNTHGGDPRGARTGRLSSSGPNYQNVPNPFGQPVPANLPPLPEMRSYCLPEQGCTWLKRDFSSQEIRILAHFEDGELMGQYKDNPSFDPHQKAMDDIEAITGMRYDRLTIKRTAFGIIYGMGIPALTASLELPPHEAAAIKDAYLRVNPGVKVLSRLTKARGDSADLGITTWGGRKYLVEPPKIIGGRMRNFGYKLLNYLIQGSAADQTKQCIIDWYKNYNDDGTFLATVHDEINISAPVGNQYKEMQGLKDAMNQNLFDVPMKSDGFAGDNWQDLKETS